MKEKFKRRITDFISDTTTTNNSNIANTHIYQPEITNIG